VGRARCRRCPLQRGREELNFSTWDRDHGKAADAIDEIVEGDMPPDEFTLVHPDAKLTDEEVDRLVVALEALDRGDPSGGDRHGARRDHIPARALGSR
jgi:hypothetical protein